MKLYKDINLTEEVPEEEFLGRVEVGEAEEYTYYLYNDTDGFLEDITIGFLDLNNGNAKNELKIVEKPSEIQPKEKAKVVLRWTPTLQVKKGLKIKFSINALEVYKN